MNAPKSIRMIDKHASLCRNPIYNPNVVRGLTKAVQQSPKVDSRIQAEEVASAIGVCMDPFTGGNDPCRAYATLKHWYQHTSARSPNPSWTNTEKVRVDFQTLYHREEPHTPGTPGNTRGPGPSKLFNLIEGGVGGSGSSPASP